MRLRHDRSVSRPGDLQFQLQVQVKWLIGNDWTCIEDFPPLAFNVDSQKSVNRNSSFLLIFMESLSGQPRSLFSHMRLTLLCSPHPCPLGSACLKYRNQYLWYQQMLSFILCSSIVLLKWHLGWLSVRAMKSMTKSKLGRRRFIWFTCPDRCVIEDIQVRNL